MPASSESAGNSPRPLDSTWSERLLPLRSFRALYSNIVVTTRRENIYRRGGGDRDRPRLPRPPARRPSVSVARQKRRNRLSNRVSGAAGQNRKKAGSHSASQSLLLPRFLPRARSLLCQLKFLCGRFRWQNLRIANVGYCWVALELRVDIHSMQLDAFSAQIAAPTPHCIFRSEAFSSKAGEGINAKSSLSSLARVVPRRRCPVDPLARLSPPLSLSRTNRVKNASLLPLFDLGVRPFVRYFALPLLLPRPYHNRSLNALFK